MSKEEIKKAVTKGGTLGITSETRFSQVIVVKLLESMGYDLTNEDEIGINVPIQVGHETKFADYKVSGESSCFVLDAKSPNVEVEGDIHSYDQVHSYYRILHCRYGALYNGKKLILFREESNRPVFIWRFDSDKEDLAVFEALSKENFPGALEEYLTSVERLTKLRQFIEERKTNLQESLISQVSTESGINDQNFIADHIEVKVDYISNVDEVPNEQVHINGSGTVLLKSFRDFGRDTGLEFIKKYKAWGYIRVRGKPDYLAMYNADEHKVEKVFQVKEAVELNDQVFREFSENLTRAEYDTLKNQGKKILRLGKEIPITPIPAGYRNIFRGMYTTLDKVKSAQTTDDL